MELSLSTHILDISKGVPASGVKIKLFKLENENWLETETRELAVTDADGRVKSFKRIGESVFGTYKLKFEIAEYFNRLGCDTLYPFIEVKFSLSLFSSANFNLILCLDNF
jgi:5-hydroxyisourate hydrolase